MKNGMEPKPVKITLHGAISKVLETRPDRTATIHEIAAEINAKKLYKRKDLAPLPAYQVMQRTKLSNGRYHHLFEYIEPDKVRLK